MRSILLNKRPLVVNVALILFAFVGFTISTYLAVNHYRNEIPPCYVTSGCEEVISSKFSMVGGIPLSLVGTFFFGVMFYMGIYLRTATRRTVVWVYRILASGGVLVALWLFLLQAAVLKAYCFYCLSSEGIAVLIWVGSLVAGDSRILGKSDVMPPVCDGEATAGGGDGGKNCVVDSKRRTTTAGLYDDDTTLT